MPIDALYNAIRNAPNQQGWQAAQQREAASHQAAIDEAVAREQAAQQAQQLWNGYDYNAEAERRAQVGGFDASKATQQADPLVSAMYYAQQNIPNGRWRADPQQMGQQYTMLPGTDVPANSARGQAMQAVDLQAGAAKAVQDAIDPFAFSNTTPGILDTKDRTRAYTTAGEILRSADATKQQIADYNTDADFAKAQEAQQKAADDYRRRQATSETEAGNQLAELYRQRDELQKLISTTSSAFRDSQGQALNSARQEQLARINAQIRQYEADVAAVEKNRLLNEYAKNAYNADFRENSQYRKTYGDEAVQNYGLGALFGGTGENKFVDIDDNARLYELINGNSEIKEQRLQDTQNAGGDASAAIVNAADPLQVVKYMSDREKALFNYIYNTQGGDAARQYYDLLVADLNARHNVAETQRWAKEAKEHPLGASIASVAASPMKGLSLVGQTADMLSGEGIDANAPYNTFSNMPSTVRSQVAHDIERNYGKAGSFAYNTAMSMADNLWQMAITGGEPGQNLMLAIMGSGAAADSVRAAKARGLSDGQAYALGLASGVIEVLTEKIGLDALYEGIRGGKTALRAILNSTLAEGSEEVLGTFLDDIADMIIAGTDSERLQRIAELKAQGMSDSKAAGRAFVDLLKEAGVAGLSGALSGLLMSGGAQTIINGYNSASSASGPTNIFSQQYNENLLNEAYLNPDGEHQWQYGSDLLAEQERQERRNAKAAQTAAVPSETPANPAVSAPTASQTATDTATQTAQETPIQNGENGQTSLFAADNGGTTITESQPSDTAQTAPTQSSTAQTAPATNTVGAAETGYNYADMPREQKVSRQYYTTDRYSDEKGTARLGDRTRYSYRNAFTYETRSRAESMARARDELFAVQDGKEIFLGDLDPQYTQDVMNDLRSFPAWNDVMTDMAKIVEEHLLAKSLEARISGTAEQAKSARKAYTDWQAVVQDRVRAGARGMNVLNDWSGEGNEDGDKTEIAAVEAVKQNGKLTNAQKTDLVDDMRDTFARIREAGEDAAALKDIIVECGVKRQTLSERENNIMRRIFVSNLDLLDVNELRQLAFGSAAALGLDYQPTNVMQKVKTVQVLNMLSNPKTPVTNTTSNLAFNGIDTLAMRLGTLLDIGLSKLTGTRSIANARSVFTRAAWQQIRKAAARSIAEVVADVNMGGEGKYSQTGTRSFKMKDPFLNKVMSIWERNSNLLLQSTDEVAKGITRAAVQDPMQRLVDEGKVNSEDENYAQTYADNLARYRTFQNDRMLSQMTRGLHDALNIITPTNIKLLAEGRKAEVKPGQFGLGDIVAPFSKIGGNLVGVALDYSPIKAITGIVQTGQILYKAARSAATGNAVTAEEQARALSNTARGLTGTAIVLGFMALVRAGLVRRADDDNVNAAQLNQAQNRYGTQLNLSAAARALKGGSLEWQDGDTLIDISRFEPFNFMLDLALTIEDNVDETDGMLSKVSGLSQAMLESFGNNVSDMPVFQTVGSFAEDVAKYQNKWWSAAANAGMRTLVSSVTPNIVAAFAKGVDDKLRDTRTRDVGDDTLLNAARSTLGMGLDTLISRLPVLRETLPSKRNVMGEEKPNPGDLATRLANAMINPMGVNEYDATEATDALNDIYAATGDASFFPRTRSSTKSLEYTENGEKHTIPLDYEQRQAFQEAYSTAYWDVANAMVKLPEFKRLAPEEQAKALGKLEKYAYQKAKQPYVGDKHIDKWVRNASKNTTSLARWLVANR